MRAARENRAERQPLDDQEVGGVVADAPQLLDRKFSPLFTTGLMLKDLDLALSLATEHGLELPGTAAVRDAYAATAAAGRRDEDFSAVIEQLGGRARETS